MISFLKCHFKNLFTMEERGCGRFIYNNSVCECKIQRFMEIETERKTVKYRGENNWELVCTETGIEIILDERDYSQRYDFDYEEILDIDIQKYWNDERYLIVTTKTGITDIRCDDADLLFRARRNFLLYKEQMVARRQQKMEIEIEQLKETVQMLLYAPGGPMYKLAEADFKENISERK